MLRLNKMIVIFRPRFNKLAIRMLLNYIPENVKNSTNVESRLTFCSELSNKTYKWQQPTACDTGIKVYNSATHSVMPLLLKNENVIKWYICGPTVYDDVHIGHGTCYVRFDIIRRILEDYFNIEVFMAMSITNIDDKIIAKSLEMAMTTETVAQHYEKEFFRDMNALGVQPPTVTCRVTEHLEKIIAFCEKILQKGLAYVTVDGTVYFDTTEFGKSGPFASMGEKVEPRIAADPHKHNSKDFALWKGAKPGEPSWNSPWGKGRPGWHIECSAMASHIFGDQIDIHSGGQDLAFPHHENEEIQSITFHGCGQWVNYWMHSGLLTLKDTEKMSKSLNNSVRIKDFLKENSANDFRMMCLMSSYRNAIEFSTEVLESARVKVKRLKSFVDDCEAYLQGQLHCEPIDEQHLLKRLGETKQLVKTSLANDFNTPQSLNAIFDLIADAYQYFSSKPLQSNGSLGTVAISACLSYVLKVTRLFGMDLPTKQSLVAASETSKNILPDVMDALLEFRRRVRLYALTEGPQSKPQYARRAVEESGEDTQLPQLPEQPLETSAEWTNHETKPSKVARKERDPLLQACDQIRNDLYAAGVAIQDRGNVSSWSLLDICSLEARKFRESERSTFEPQYQPKIKSSKGEIS